MQPDASSVSVVVPVYGCKSCLEELVERVSTAIHKTGRRFEIILVDDNSPDDAWSRITELSRLYPHVRGLRLSRNFGQHAAISAGLSHVTGEAIIVMDCDLQDIPEEIPTLLAALHQKDVEVVLGQRVDRQDSRLKRLGSKLFYQTLGWLTDTHYDHTTANFGAFSRKVIDVINAMPERERCFPLMVKWTGFRSVVVPVMHARRREGRSGYSLKRLIGLAANIILSYSDKPLRLVIRLGLAFSVLAFVMATFSVLRFLHGDVQLAGFTSIIASIWLVGGVSIFCLGIVGLYVGKQFNDSKGRPYFIVSEYTSKSPINTD